jgi:DNA-nicking Smr family endonuclease
VDESGAVRIPIEDALDLHTFAPRDVASVVDEYLREAQRAGFPEVRLIHGRGTGTQRAIVRRLLNGHPLVEAFADAPPGRGGWGATLVTVKSSVPDPRGGDTGTPHRAE